MELLRAILLLALFFGMSFAIPVGLKKIKAQFFRKPNGRGGGSCCS